METSPPYIVDKPTRVLSGERQRCCTCRQEKAVEDFYFQNRRLGQRQPYCKMCKAEYNRAWYARNREKQKADVERSRRLRRMALKRIVEDLKQRPCDDCGKRYPPIVLDFDHVRGSKVANISMLVNDGVPPAQLLDEIAKCDLVCSNCHRLRTAARRTRAAE